MMDATNDRTKKILIIGGGVAGLATGCYGRLQGYETQILEMHGLPGGLCTSWERKGYVVDGCIHWLMGTRPGTSFYPLWQEIGALDGLSFLQHKLIYRVEGPSGEGVDLPADVDQLEHALIAFSPEDEGVIRELIQAVRAMMKVEMPMDKAPDLYNLRDLINLLKGRYRNKRIDALYHEVPLAPTTVQVSLGLSCDLADEPEALSICLDQPFKVGGVDNSLFCMRHYRYDPTMAPPGCSTLIGYLNTDYDYWEKLRKDKPSYQAEKERIADEFVRLVSKRFPGTAGRVDMVDVATPCTYVRYTGTWKGVYMSWLASPRYARLSVPGRLPGLRHFYMAGQWANAGGGVPVGVMTARWTLQRIRKDDRKQNSRGK